MPGATSTVGPLYQYSPDNIESLSGTIPTFPTLNRKIVAGSQGCLTSGVLCLSAAEIPAGQVVNNLGFQAGGTAAVTPTHWWMVLCTLAGIVLGVTADQLATAVPAFGFFPSIPMTGPVQIPGGPIGRLQQVFLGFMMNAATVCSMEGAGTLGVAGSSPPVSANAGAGLTTPPAVGSSIGALVGPVGGNPLLWAF